MILKRKDKPKANYTVVSNAFLRDPSLSLKAKGMLALLLTLPDDWNVSVCGLRTLTPEKTAALRNALDELLGAGYISADTVRDQNGAYKGIDYIINDKTYGLPFSENPLSGNPLSGNPRADNQQLLNKEIQNKEKENKEKQNCFVSPDKGPEENGSGGAFEF